MKILKVLKRKFVTWLLKDIWERDFKALTALRDDLEMDLEDKELELQFEIGKLNDMLIELSNDLEDRCK